MFIPLGMRYTSRASIVIKRNQLCPKCGCGYSYQCKVKATARAGSFMFLNNAGARARASEVAKDRLARKVAKAQVPVPCPQCLYLAPSFVWKGAFKLLPFVLLGGFTLLMGFAASQPSQYDTPTPAAKALGPFCSLLGCLIILLPATLYLYRIALSVPSFRRAAVRRYNTQVLSAGYRPGDSVAPATQDQSEFAPSDGWHPEDDDSIPFADSSSKSGKPAPPPTPKISTVKKAVNSSAPPAKPSVIQSKTAFSKPPSTTAAAKPATPSGSTVVASCGNCGKSFRVNSKFAGKKAKCTGCSAAITIPAS